ncbi:MAG TPA: ligase-associated DNA damage response DEXH box helicase [Acidisoma sp.]|uniref:ligase-associated DNA damage response DEXH box helicase n=1 Tax=Acidisoma sp. TaxID=1872115 RepID=UPI002B51CECD|nr:ligase-associated DNA damage response DEXH box helicase [Acidisoma sp.]HTI00741.1 ligase-associated DNA damage response DEXH box helicase [Acidisoma sp.]
MSARAPARPKPSRQTAQDKLLPAAFRAWFAGRGWQARPHQLEVLEAFRRGRHVLLIAPTGGGKTLSGFLPSLVDLALPRPEGSGVHTIYVSPLKALATDIARNLSGPVAEMALPIRIETRTGDTPQNRRARQRENPPDILLTTPESLALLLSQDDATHLFRDLRSVIIDEVHALAGIKRGDLLALGLARLARLAPQAQRIGLSATVAWPQAIAAYVAADGQGGGLDLIEVADPAPPDLSIMLPAGHLPWGGHMGLAAAPDILARIREAGLTIVFVNTRAQAELLFQEIWRINEETLPVAIHHGSLDVAQRRKVEAAMAEGRLRAVIATSSLDLGIDWGGVDQVIQVGAPKGVSRLLQRVGRANHRMDETSRAVLVPANRFEALECEAARQGVAARELDGDAPHPGGLDVLAQHLLGLACAGPFHPDDAFAEIRHAAPYAALDRKTFDDVLGFVENGGYALRVYERYAKLFRDSEGRVHLRNARIARQYRMNIGTIVEAPMIRLRLGRGASLGEVEEWFITQLAAGDTFMFAGRLLRFLRLRETWAEVADGGAGTPKVPTYQGGRLPLSTGLAARVRALLHDPTRWPAFPEPVQEWLRLQGEQSALPGPDDLLVETFPRHGLWYLVAYCFEGRNAHQTLGMLLTRRMERFGQGPLGFVATDYVLAIWSASEPRDLDALFDEEMMGDDLEAWMAESSMLRRTFRNVAVISGLVDRQMPGAERNRRQVTVNTDLIYDVLRRHDPNHILLRATWADAAGGMTDLGRLAGMLGRVRGHITHRSLPHVSPLAVPVILDIGREQVAGAGEEDLLAEAEALVSEATGEEHPENVLARSLTFEPRLT